MFISETIQFDVLWWVAPGIIIQLAQFEYQVGRWDKWSPSNASCRFAMALRSWFLLGIEKVRINQKLLGRPRQKLSKSNGNIQLEKMEIGDGISIL